jgi:hypothetical protein
MVTEKEYLDAGLQTGIHEAYITFDFENQLLFDRAYNKYYTIPQLELIAKMAIESIAQIKENKYNIEATNIKLQNERDKQLSWKSTSPKATSNKSKFVYIAFDSYSDTYKIGYTGNINNRLKQLRIGNPYLSILYFVNGGRTLERKLHSIFEVNKVDGEWFKLSSKDIEFLKSDYLFNPYNHK